jgi:hypothetical protein
VEFAAKELSPLLLAFRAGFGQLFNLTYFPNQMKVFVLRFDYMLSNGNLQLSDRLLERFCVLRMNCAEA